jgi:hypothetical protein
MDKTTLKIARKARLCAVTVAARKPSYAPRAVQGMTNKSNIMKSFWVLLHKVFAAIFEAVQPCVVENFFKESDICDSAQEDNARVDKLPDAQIGFMWESTK